LNFYLLPVARTATCACCTYATVALCLLHWRNCSLGRSKTNLLYHYHWSLVPCSCLVTMLTSWSSKSGRLWAASIGRLEAFYDLYKNKCNSKNKNKRAIGQRPRKKMKPLLIWKRSNFTWKPKISFYTEPHYRILINWPEHTTLVDPFGY
jgi:hypothetical protein